MIDNCPICNNKLVIEETFNLVIFSCKASHLKIIFSQTKSLYNDQIAYSVICIDSFVLYSYFHFNEDNYSNLHKYDGDEMLILVKNNLPLVLPAKESELLNKFKTIVNFL